MWVPLGIQHPAGLSYINSTNPSSEILGETAATMAATAVIFKSKDEAYSNKLVDHAKDLYNRAITHNGTYMKSTDPNLKTLKEWYPSSLFYDELAWSAAWLYVATKDQVFLDQANEHIKKAADHGGEVRYSGAVNELRFTSYPIPPFFSTAGTKSYPVFTCYSGWRPATKHTKLESRTL